ncbi:MAG: sugar ABC transporter permease [Infirmifilum sp.]
MLYLLLFLGGPLAVSLYLLLGNPEALKFMVSDPSFPRAVEDTLLLAALIIPVQFILALLAALLFNRKFYGSSVFTFIFIIPLLLSDVSASIIWYNILSGSGYLNKFLLNTGITKEPLQILGYQSPLAEIMAIVVSEVWRATSLVFIIIFAGLQYIPREYFEAADVFGATPLQKMFHVTLPLLKPSIQVALILRTLYAFQVFAPMWILTGRDIPVLAGEAYYWYTILINPYVSTLYSIIIALISIIFTVLYLRITR